MANISELKEALEALEGVWLNRIANAGSAAELLCLLADLTGDGSLAADARDRLMTAIAQRAEKS